MRDVVQPAGQDEVGRVWRAESKQCLAVLQEQQARILARQRYQAEWLDRRACRLRAQAREPLELRQRRRADPAEIAPGQGLLCLFQGELEIGVRHIIPAPVAVAPLAESPLD